MTEKLISWNRAGKGSVDGIVRFIISESMENRLFRVWSTNPDGTYIDFLGTGATRYEAECIGEKAFHKQSTIKDC